MPGLIWIEPPNPNSRERLHRDPLLHAILSSRVADAAAARDFLDPRPRPLPDVERLPGLTAAAERVAQAIEHGETIAVFGDYDADGITAVAVLVLALRQAIGDPDRVLVRLPTRSEGYGLNKAAIDRFAEQGARLLIAADCASTDSLHVAYAQHHGLEVVVLDHHQLSAPPPAGAVVASAQLDPAGSLRELTAVGVAYLLVATLADWGLLPPTEPLLDLVALGTIADVAPLTGANRPLVRDGLRVIQRHPRPGIAALCESTGIEPARLTSEQIAFKLAPRLNAAGRMADPAIALGLLLTDDPAEAATRAIELDALNRRRRAESDRIVAEAEQELRQRRDLDERRLLVLARPNWGRGVLGLAASRLADRYQRPVVVLNADGETSHGSARSVPGFDIARALAAHNDLLIAHGGHTQAAGLTVATANIPYLESVLAAAVASELPAPVPAELRIDADLPAERLDLDTVALLDTLQPFGVGNPTPQLRLRRLPVRSYNTIGRDGSHLKLHLQTSRGVRQAIAWGAAGRSRELLMQPAIDLVVALSADYWGGSPRLQIEIKDFKEATN